MAGGSFNPLPIGAIVHERYRISAVVGRGGLGTVYQVMDVLFGKSNVYALKELIDQSPGARKQFENESLWLQSLDHNSIPKVREHFAWQGRLYLVMDFVDGENLERKLARNGGRPLPEQDALRWILPICDALHYLHTRLPPILHRDVKPANIIVTPAGHSVLVDLGIAKEHLPGAGQTATFVRKAGTEGYAPPEQYAAAGQTGPWSDVYGVGATLYQLLTGRVPPTAVERVALDAKLLSPRAFNPAISPSLDSAIARAMALRPAERFQSMRDFAQALTIPPASGVTPGRTPSPAPSRVTRPPFSATPSLPIPGAPARRSPPPYATHPLTPTPSPPIPPSPASMAFSRAGGKDVQPGLSAASMAAPDAGMEAQQRTITPLSEDPGAHHARTAGSARRPLYRSPLVLGAGVACAVLIAVIVAVLLLSATTPPDRSSPQATVTGYFAALSTQGYQRAWQYMALSLTNVTSESSFINGVKSDDSRLGRVVSAHIASVDSAGSQAFVQVDVTRMKSRGTAMSETLDLTQFDNDTWLINSININA